MNPVDFSIVLPCLNEENTIGRCIDKIQAFFKTTPYSFEIVVADNGSTDRSQEIARTKQARIVLEPIKGYGNALKKGIENCYGKYIIMGDADDSYNFLELHDFIKRLEDGYDMVIGNRFAGGIHHQAMPWLHRYIGNPILSSIARILFKNNIKDYHCGLRAFKTDCYHELNPQCQGMEFASELIVLAIIHHRLISEVPVTLYPDGRNRKSHLVTWRDGYRHLRLLLQLYIHPR